MTNKQILRVQIRSKKTHTTTLAAQGSSTSSLKRGKHKNLIIKEMPEFEEHEPKPMSDSDLNYKPSKSPQAKAAKETPKKELKPEVAPEMETTPKKEDSKKEVAPKLEAAPKMEVAPKMETSKVEKEAPKAAPASNMRGRWKRSPQSEKKNSPTAPAAPVCGEVDPKGFQEKLSGTSPHKPKQSPKRSSESTRSERTESEKPKTESRSSDKRSSDTPNRERTRSSRPSSSDASKDGKRRPAAKNSNRGNKPSGSAVSGSVHKPKDKSSPGLLGAIKKAVGSIFGGEPEPKKTEEKPRSRSSQGRYGGNRSSNANRDRGQGGRSNSGQRGGQRRSGGNRPRGGSSGNRSSSQKSS